MDGGQTTIQAEERVDRPLFSQRPNHQCCWPMWGDGRDIETKRVCGALVQASSKIPYCPEHLSLHSGRGTESERATSRFMTHISKLGAPK